MDENEFPRELRAPLELADPHLHEQQREHAEAEPEKSRRAVTKGGEVADREQEREQEEADDGAVEVHRPVELPEAADVRAAARMRPGRGRERPADDEHEAGRGEDEGEEPQLARNERHRAAIAEAHCLDSEDDGPGKQRDREQEMRHHDRPAEVARDGEVAERSLGKRADEDEQGNPARPAREAGRPPRSEPRDERERDDDRTDEPVPELDEGVDIAFGERLAALAAGPMAAAEPRIGQANGRAAADDQPEAECVRDRELEEARRGELELRMRASTVEASTELTLKKGVEQLGIPVGARERGRP